MTEDNVFVIHDKNKVFKVPLAEHVLFYSENLTPLYLLFNDIKESFNTKNSDYKKILKGHIPDLSLSNNINVDFKNNIFSLTYDNNFDNTIFESLNIISIFKDDFLASFAVCPKCKEKLKETSIEDISKNILKDFNNSLIAIGTLNYHNEIINIKELIKKNIYYIISNNQILELDEIINTDIKNYLLVDKKISANNSSEIIDFLSKIKKTKNDFFIFTLNENKLYTFNFSESLSCPKCKEKFPCQNYVSLEYLKNAFKNLSDITKNLYFENITIKDLLTTPFNNLISLIKNRALHNILKLLINYNLGENTFLSTAKEFETGYILNYIKIKQTLTKNDIVCIQNPLSFLSDKIFKNLLNELNGNSVIVFENNQSILQYSFKNIFYLDENITKEKEKSYQEINKTINKNFNITLPIIKNKINVLSSDLLEKYLSTENFSNEKIIIMCPLFQKDTFLASTIDIFDTLRDILLKTTDAKKLGLTKKDFFIKASNKYLCQTCLGKGNIKNLLNVEETCPKCNGNLFDDKILNLKFKDISFREILNLSVLDAINFFSGFLKIQKKLKFLSDLNFNKLTLNCPCEKLPPNIINMLNISKKINLLDKNLIFIIKNAFAFLSNKEKVRFINAIMKNFNNCTIILESNKRVL